MAVYWIGADGNAYLKSSSGVTKYTNPTGVGDKGFQGLANGRQGQSVQASRIADPNPPAPRAPANPNGPGSGGGGASAPVLPDKSNDIALQNAGLSAIDTQTNTGLGAVDRALGGLVGQYDTERNTNEKTYTESTNQNTNNLQKNKQTALVNAAEGRRGLNGTLASIGALNGTGITLADRAVQKGANDDLSAADENFAGNKSTLETSIGLFRQEDERRRQDARTAAENAKTNVQNNAAQGKLAAFKALADDYSVMGNAAEAQRYTQMATEILPTIASTSIPSSNLAYTGAAFTPTTLATYLAGGNPTTVSAAPAAPGQRPGLIATTQPKKKQLETA